VTQLATDGELQVLPWRTGRKVGRTIYAVVGKEPSDRDILIGMMDTPALAVHVVAAHNRFLLEFRP
jgi:hypothetical protein